MAMQNDGIASYNNQFVFHIFYNIEEDEIPRQKAIKLISRNSNETSQ